MDEEFVCELILQPLEDFNNICDRAAVDTIIHLTRCGREYFRKWWKSLKDSDRYFLRCLVSGKTPTDQNPKIVRKLVRKEVLHQQGDRILVPLVQKFIEQVVEEEE